MSLFKANPQRQAELARLRVFLESLPDGEDVFWMRIEAETKVTMNQRGRSLVRHVLEHQIDRPWIPLIGDGIRLSAPDNGTDIMGRRFQRIDRTVRRADKTSRQLTKRNHLPDEVSASLAAFFGQIRVIAKSADQFIFGRMKMHAERLVLESGKPRPPGV